MTIEDPGTDAISPTAPTTPRPLWQRMRNQYALLCTNPLRTVAATMRMSSANDQWWR